VRPINGLEANSRRRRRRSKLTRGLSAIVLSVSIVGLAAGCGSSSSSSSGTLNVAIDSGVTSLDPAQACTAFYDYTIVKNLYDTLVQYGTQTEAGGKTKIVPGLASSYDQSPDGKTWTFHLRKDVKFTSGNPMTAADVVYGLNRVLKSGGCQAYVMTWSAKIESIKALDKYTVQIKTNRSDPLFLDSMAQTGVSPIDKKVLEQHGGLTPKGDNWIATHSAGTGAYALTSDQPDSQLELQAQSDYWQGTPKSKTVVIKVVTDPTSLDTLARSGQVDMAYGVPLKDLSSMDSAGRQLISHQIPFQVYFGLNNKAAPTNNVEVRQAIQEALPLKSIAGQLGYGHVRTYGGPIPPARPFVPTLPVPKYDVAQAKSLRA
jgi:peptide/nickel transport system substrate-binding protein